MKPTLVLYLGSVRGTPVEDLVGRAQQALALDNAELAARTGLFREVVLVTDANLEFPIPDGVVVERQGGPNFHFGQSLADLVARRRPEAVVYLGGGFGPFIDVELLGDLVGRLAGAEAAVIANNIFSADLVAFRPAEALLRVSLPARDNPLAQVLYRQAGLPISELPRSARTQFDLDTPTDLAVLKYHGVDRPRLGQVLAGTQIDISRLEAAAGWLVEPYAEVIVAGRVGSYVLAHLERETACRTRVFSEERGMQADGREERGQVRSVLGFLLEAVGVEAFFERMARLGQAMFLDSRVLFAHLGLRLSRADRFYSDLGDFEAVLDPLARRVTAAAAQAPIPVVMGAHSLVSGGLYAVIDAAWRIHDQALLGETYRQGR